MERVSLKELGTTPFSKCLCESEAINKARHSFKHPIACYFSPLTLVSNSKLWTVPFSFISSFFRFPHPSSFIPTPFNSTAHQPTPSTIHFDQSSTRPATTLRLRERPKLTDGCRRRPQSCHGSCGRILRSTDVREGIKKTRLGQSIVRYVGKIRLSPRILPH